MAADKNTLTQQLRRDPRVMQLVQQRGRAGIITGAELKRLGYDVPDSWQFRALNPRSGKTGPDAYGVTDNGINGLEVLPVVAGTAMLGYGVGDVINTAVNDKPSASGDGSDTIHGDGLPDGTPPLGGVTPESNGNPPGGGGGPRSVGQELLDSLLTPQGLATLAGTIGSIATQGGGVGDDPNAKALVEMALKRQQRTDPLHESVTRLANAMLPTAYQSGR